MLKGARHSMNGRENRETGARPVRDRRRKSGVRLHQVTVRYTREDEVG